MKLKDVELTRENHFIAMQYYGLILNRVFLVLIMEDHLVGIVVNELVSASGGNDLLMSRVRTHLAIDGGLDDPLSYLNDKYLDKANGLHLLRDNLLENNKSNFRYGLKKVESVRYDPKKKWGMGCHPSDGKIYIRVENVNYEFILLGSQSGLSIKEYITSAIKSSK